MRAILQWTSQHLGYTSHERGKKSHATVMRTTILLLGKIGGHLISINGKRKKLFLKKAISLA